MTRSFSLVALLVMAFSVCVNVAGCGTVQVQWWEDRLQPYKGRHIEGFVTPPPGIDINDWTLYVAEHNRYVLDRDYATERSFYKTGEDRPDLAVAFSGGGMRSAVFSIGVLSALVEKDPADFERVDFMSSVSGGGYALSWYYLQQYYLARYGCVQRMYGADVNCDAGSLCPACPQRVVERDGAFQQRLRKHGGLMGKIRGIFHGTIDLVVAPFNLFVNGVFGTHSNTTPSRGVYEKRIAQVFHRLPAAACGGYTNGYLGGSLDPISNWFTIGNGDSNISFPDLGQFAEDKKLPFFIINTTAFVDDDPSHYAARLSNTVYEFTPLHLGSSGFGYYNWPEVRDPISVGRAVSISGAAVDGAIIAGSSEKTLWSALNIDTGYFIDNPSPNPNRTQRFVHNLLPLPVYFGHHYIKDKNGVKVYLTDGGHSDNLGVFSAVKRLPKRLIVVDGEQDYDSRFGSYTFDGYYRVKAALKSELGVDFTVPQIENELKWMSPYTTPVSVMYGKISGFPYCRAPGAPPELAEIEVRYIKLSIDRNNLAIYPASVQSYYEQTKDAGCSGLLSKCAFPQESTTDLSYSGEQFDAYRDLGYWMVEKNFGPWESASIKPIPGVSESRRCRE